MQATLLLAQMRMEEFEREAAAQRLLSQVRRARRAARVAARRDARVVVPAVAGGSCR